MRYIMTKDKTIKMDYDTWNKMKEVFGTSFINDKNIEITGKEVKEDGRQNEE